MNLLKIWDKINDFLGTTPFHPQYLVIKYQKKINQLVLSKTHGRVLDIGCGRQILKRPIEQVGCHYTSLDHPTIYRRQRAHLKPSILADITQIPTPTGSFDRVLLLMVLPHLPHPLRGLKEVRRILSSGGLVFISAIENYPGHDLPDDYFRYRLSGLKAISTEAGLTTIKSYSWGNFWEVNALNFNLFLLMTAKHFLDKTSNGFATGILILVFYPLMFTSNLLAITLGPTDIIKRSRLINFIIAQKND